MLQQAWNSGPVSTSIHRPLKDVVVKIHSPDVIVIGIDLHAYVLPMTIARSRAYEDFVLVIDTPLIIGGSL